MNFDTLFAEISAYISWLLGEILEFLTEIGLA